MQFDIDSLYNAGTLWVKSLTMRAHKQSAGLPLQGSSFLLYVTSWTFQRF